MAKGFTIRRMPGFTVVAAACFLFLYLPVLTMGAYAFNAGESIAIWQGFSFRWFVQAWKWSSKIFALLAISLWPWASSILI